MFQLGELHRPPDTSRTQNTYLLHQSFDLRRGNVRVVERSQEMPNWFEALQVFLVNLPRGRSAVPPFGNALKHLSANRGLLIGHVAKLLTECRQRTNLGSWTATHPVSITKTWSVATLEFSQNFEPHRARPVTYVNHSPTPTTVNRRPRFLEHLLVAERSHHRVLAIACVALASLVSSACRSNKRTVTEEQLAALDLTPEEAKRILTQLSTKRAEHEPPSAPSVTSNQPSEEPIPVVSRQPTDGTSSVWVFDELEDIGPAAPSSASPQGVFLINGGNELFLAKLGQLRRAAVPQATPIGVVPDVKGPFALGRGPVFTKEYAYWVTSHFLLRRPTAAPYGPLEIIAEDARVGTRPSAIVSPVGAAVAYIALPRVKDGPLRARVWREQDAPKTAKDLTDPGNSTLSVSLVPRPNGALVVSLEARMGVTALHARSFDVKSGNLGPDIVPWVGGTAQPFTEVRTLGKQETFLSFLAMEQDSSHFGLAVLEHAANDSPPNVHWLTYPNGLDPAPVAATSTCGKDVVLFTRPSDPAPQAPQELVLAEITAGTLSNPTVLSTARAYYDVSIAPLPGGALLSFVADRRTWARTVRCAPTRSK